MKKFLKQNVDGLKEFVAAFFIGTAVAMIIFGASIIISSVQA